VDRLVSPSTKLSMGQWRLSNLVEIDRSSFRSIPEGGQVIAQMPGVWRGLEYYRCCEQAVHRDQSASWRPNHSLHEDVNQLIE
jgi:hypothetical protein